MEPGFHQNSWKNPRRSLQCCLSRSGSKEVRNSDPHRLKKSTKKETLNKFYVWKVLCDPERFSCCPNSFVGVLGDIYDGFWYKKKFLCHKNPWSGSKFLIYQKPWSGSRFSKMSGSGSETLVSMTCLFYVSTPIPALDSPPACTVVFWSGLDQTALEMYFISPSSRLF